jgi:hypothetical protein
MIHFSTFQIIHYPLDDFLHFRDALLADHKHRFCINIKITPGVRLWIFGFLQSGNVLRDIVKSFKFFVLGDVLNLLTFFLANSRIQSIRKRRKGDGSIFVNIFASLRPL